MPYRPNSKFVIKQRGWKINYGKRGGGGKRWEEIKQGKGKREKRKGEREKQK